MKLGFDDPCWCGSGRKYKECHLERSKEPGLPYPALRQKTQKEFETKKCLHPLASSSDCGKVSAAHTIQRAGALRDLVDTTKHVMTFYPVEFDDNGLPIPKKVGWRNASTFSGFCEKHDGKTFEPLETIPFTGTPEQCFLLGYRALCHEVYQKAASARANLLLRDYIDKGLSVDEQEQIQHTLAIQRAGVNHGLESAMAKKQIMDKHFLEKDFREWKRFIVKFQGNISVASTGTPTPMHDLSGKQIQILHDPDTHVQYLLYGVTPIQDGGAVVFSWHSKDIASNAFMNSLNKISRKLLPNILVQFMFAYVENTFFSKDWWNSLGNEQQTHIKKLAGIFNPYYQKIEYVNDVFVPWKITSVEYY